MNKGRTGVENSTLSKPTWEIMKFISEITDFCWELIFGAVFEALMPAKMWETYRFVHQACWIVAYGNRSFVHMFC